LQRAETVGAERRQTCAERGDRRYGEMRHATGDAKRRQAEQRNKTGRADSLQEVLWLETEIVKKLYR
jgi:hypothetical protein